MLIDAATQAHIWSSWSNFWSWADSSNVASCVMAVVLPGGAISWVVHKMHRKHKAEMHARHDAIEQRLSEMNERLVKVHRHSQENAVAVKTVLSHHERTLDAVSRIEGKLDHAARVALGREES